MPSSNPVFGRGFGNAATGQQNAGYGAPQYGAPAPYGAPPQDPYAAPSPYAPSTTQYMTMDDVVTKTGLSLLVTVLSAAVTWLVLPDATAIGLALPAVLVAFVLGLVISFKQVANAAATLSYGALYGVALGAISEASSLESSRASDRPREANSRARTGCTPPWRNISEVRNEQGRVAMRVMAIMD